MTYDFIVDSMLGKTAKWLRVLGYSVYYNADSEDNHLIDLARKYSAELITRDKKLFYKALKEGVKAVLVTGVSNKEVLKELRNELNIRLFIDIDKTRCPKCNGLLRKMSRERIKEKVPLGVWESYKVFFVCKECGAIYWMGKHFKSMKEILDSIRGD